MAAFSQAVRKIGLLAGRQYGHVTRGQLLALGVSSAAIGRWVTVGFLIPVHAGVYAVGHRRSDAIARAAAALLACGPGAVLSHDTAAALWGFRRRWPETPEVTIDRRRTRPGITVHRSVTLTRTDIRRHRGLRATSPARTLTDIRPRLTTKEFRRAVDDARLAGQLTAAAARRLTGEGGAPSRSDWERDFRGFVAEFGLPEPRYNVTVAGYERDVVFPEHRLIVELDSWRHHQGRDAFESDRQRDMTATEHGYASVRLTWERYTRARAAEARRLQTILRRRAGATPR